MLPTFLLVVVLLLAGLFFYLLKRRRLKKIQRMFQAYNREQNIDVIIDWIKAGRVEQRLLQVLDYLQQIEEFEQALKIYEAFGVDTLKSRHVRIFGARLFQRMKRRDEALLLAERLMETYPGDDSVLDIFLDIQLGFENWETAKRYLEPRLERKFKGTVFPKHYARILAAEKNYRKAITIMENVVEKDHILFQNTYAQPQKRLIGEQYEKNMKFLEELKGQMEGKGTGASATVEEA